MRKTRPGRHKKVDIDPEDYPSWMLDENVGECLFALGEEVLEAKALADLLRASERPSSFEPYAAAMKSLARLNNEKLSVDERSRAGARAMRKFWDAKVAARRMIIRGSRR